LVLRSDQIWVFNGSYTVTESCVFVRFRAPLQPGNSGFASALIHRRHTCMGYDLPKFDFITK
jgi:hypothetical protein